MKKDSEHGTEQTGARERLMDVAEREFAQHGYHGSSLRTITRGASVALGLVGHHFGGKKELLRAVYDRLFAEFTEDRIRSLEELMKRKPHPTLEELYEAAFEPMHQFFCHSEGPQRALFSLRGVFEHEIFWPMVSETAARVGNRFTEAFSAALPDVPPEEVVMRWGAATILFVTGVTPTFRNQNEPRRLTANEVETYHRMAFLVLAGRPPLHLPQWSVPD